MLKKCFFHVNEHNEALCWWGSVCDSHTVAVELSHSSFTRCLLLVFPICGHSGQICEFVSDDYHSFWLMWASSSGFIHFMVNQVVVNYWNRALCWITYSDRALTLERTFWNSSGLWPDTDVWSHIQIKELYLDLGGVLFILFISSHKPCDIMSVCVDHICLDLKGQVVKKTYLII